MVDGELGWAGRRSGAPAGASPAKRPEEGIPRVPSADGNGSIPRVPSADAIHKPPQPSGGGFTPRMRKLSIGFRRSS
jgi:hypothetical protein